VNERIWGIWEEVLEIPSRELRYNTENLIDILGSLTEVYTEMRQVEEIIGMIPGIEEEEGEKHKPRKKPDNSNRKQKTRTRMHRR